MTAIKLAGLESFLRKPDPAISAVLIYGDEPGAVRDIAAVAVRQLAGSVDDPFAVVNMQDGDLAGDPGRLADEVQSQSMFGGMRVVWLRDAGDAFARAASPLLDGKLAGNIVVAEAAGLPKSSLLRQLFEKSRHGLILPLYEAEPGEVAGVVESILAADDIQIDQDAVHRFIELTGTGRGIVRREAEKLALYCLGTAKATLADVEAICGNATGAEPDDLADRVMAGDVAEADRLFHRLVDGGNDPGRLLSVLHSHILRLQDLKANVERGTPPDQVLRSARPMIFFKRQPKVRTQLKIWAMSDLVAAGATVDGAVLQVRLNTPLGTAIAGRCLLSTARRALALRREQT